MHHAKQTIGFFVQFYYILFNNVFIVDSSLSYYLLLLYKTLINDPLLNTALISYSCTLSKNEIGGN